MAAFVFLCNIDTEAECITLSMFGTPQGQVYHDHHSKVMVGDQLFLYNYDTGQFKGPFLALTGCKGELVKGAFRKAGIRAVHHVRVRPDSAFKVPLTADDLSEPGLLREAPKIGLVPPASLDAAQTEIILSAFQRKNS